MVEKLNITIPTSLMEVTIGQYQRFVKETEDITDEAVLEQKVITIFCGITLNQLRLLKSNQVQDILSRLMPLVDSFNTPQPFTHRFVVGGVDYGFIPNLEQDITYGENKDITSRMSEGIDGMHKAMAILYRPIIRTSNDTYEIEKYQVPVKHEDALKEMPLAVVLGAQVFFLEFNQRITDAYPELFGKGNGGGTIQPDDEESIYQSNWGSYDEVFCLAQGDIRRFDEVTALPLHSCYMYLANNADKHRLENSRIRKRFKK